MSYSPEEAQAAVATLQKNPIPAQAAKQLHSYNAFGGWRVDFIEGVPGRHFGDVRIDDQEAAPTNPGIRDVTASTYGNTIPVSLGMRRLPGNIVQSTQMVPRLVGGYDYDVTYQIPVYEDPVEAAVRGFHLNMAGDDHDRPDPDAPPDKCNEPSPCDPPPEDEPGPGGDYTYWFAQDACDTCPSAEEDAPDHPCLGDEPDGSTPSFSTAQGLVDGAANGGCVYQGGIIAYDGM